MSESENNDTPQPQETTVIHTAPANAQNNANLIMILVMLLTLIIGLAIAFALKGGTDEEQAKKDRLIRQTAALTGDTTGSIALEGRIATIIDNSNQILSDYTSIKAGYTTAKQQLDNAKTELAGNVSTITRLSSDLTKAQADNAKYRAMAAASQSYEQQVKSLRQSNLEKDQTIGMLRGRPTQDSLNALQSRLSTEKMTKDELTREIQRLKQQMISMVDESALTQLKNRIPALEKENQDLKIELQKLRTKFDFSRLFVNSHDLLPAKAQALYTTLKGLEGMSPNQLTQAYTKIASTLNAENLQQVKFATGSSLLSFTDQTTVKNQLTATADTDYFLVVGYASTTGDAASNQTLSANRATAVASVVNQLKKQGQDVRAVYLGQTSRFSSQVKADNQLCEIWRIKK